MNFRKFGRKVGKVIEEPHVAEARKKLRNALDLDYQKIAQNVSDALENTPIADIHTHIYSENFGDLLLWGIDELLTYHYITAELFRHKPELDYRQYWNMPKQQQAELAWKEMFVNSSPISESARGVVTVLHELGLDTSDRNLEKIRKYFAEFSTTDYIDKVFKLTNIKYVIMTNDPFDEKERAVWQGPGNNDDRFKTALRIDGLVNNFSQFAPKISEQGFDITGPELDDKNLSAVKDFLKSWIDKINPVYLAASMPPDFRIDDGSNRTKIILNCIIPVAREADIPFAMMIGVKRAVNPSLRLAGDAVAKADVDVVATLARDNPDVRFLVTMLSRENQHELCVTARKFKNLLIFGCWWFLNNPSIIKEITSERIETLGLTMIPQHSDARVLDQLIYKWSHSLEIIAQILTEKYFDIYTAGWPLTQKDINRDVERILGGRLLLK